VLFILLCCNIQKLGSHSRAAHVHINISSRSRHSQFTVSPSSGKLFFASV